MNLRKEVKFSDISSGFGDALRRARLSAVEAAFLVAALAFGGFVAFFYFSEVLPISSQMTALQAKERKLADDIEIKIKNEQTRGNQASNAERILESLSRFQSMLKPDERGMTQIINEIKSLGETHSVFAGDASYRVVEAEPTVDENGNPLPATKLAEKRFNIYPTFGIDTSVIGDYPNLRRFLADLERSRQFLVINSLTFQGGDDKLSRALAQGGKQIQLSAGAVPVSVKIGLDTYFQAPANAEKQN